VIRVECDNCDKAFEVDDNQTGQKVSCPYCGDVNRVNAGAWEAVQPEPPGKPSDSPQPAGPAVLARKPASTADQPERTLAIVRSAMFRAHPFWYVLMVLLFLAGLLFTFAAPARVWKLQPSWWWFGLVAMGAAVLWWLIWWGAPHRWVKLTITNKRTIRQEGIIMRRTSEVLHNHIRNVRIEQSFMQRLLGVGGIWIDSAGGSDDTPVEIQMNNVANPYGVKQVIDQHRRL